MNAAEREAAIVRFFPLVGTIAQAVWRQVRPVELDDLVGDGSIGLIAAIDGFDPERGMSLERYARSKILYAMLDGARRSDHLTQCARRVLQIAERDRYAFALEYGRMPSPRELERRHPKLRSAQSSAQLRRPLSLDGSLTIEALVEPDWQSDPASLLCASETRSSVRVALGRLPHRHRELLGLYYAGGFRLADVARRMSVSKQRVAQLRDRALERVREEVFVS